METGGRSARGPSRRRPKPQPEDKPPAEEARYLGKEDEFLLLVQTSVQAAMQSAITKPRFGHSDIVDRAKMLAILLSDAVTVAGRLPPTMTAIDAAYDFIAYALDEGPTWQDIGARPGPAKWMGLEERTEVQDYFTPIREKIDGRWQAVNPEWDGVPFNDSVTLRILVRVRSYAFSSFAEIVAAVPEPDDGYIRSILPDLEDDGWIVQSEDTGSVAWSPTEKLARTSARYPRDSEAYQKPKASASNGLEPERDREAEWKQAREERLSSLPDKPDAKRLLEEIAAKKRCATRDLQALVPHLDRTAVTRLMKRLRDGGWVRVVGDRRNALWELAPKAGAAKAKSKTTAVAEAEERAGLPVATTAVRIVSRHRSEEEMARIERFVTENPGRKIAEIAKGLKWEGQNRLRNLVEKLYGERRLYRRQQRHYPGKDPDWE